VLGPIALPRHLPADLASAEEALRSAIAVAQGQGDSRLRAALRVAPSLAKLYQSAGRPADAHDVVGTGARRFRADAGNAGDRRGAGADGAFGVGSLTPIFRTFPGGLCRAGISRIEASKAPDPQRCFTSRPDVAHLGPCSQSALFKRPRSRSATGALRRDQTSRASWTPSATRPIEKCKAAIVTGVLRRLRSSWPYRNVTIPLATRRRHALCWTSRISMRRSTPPFSGPSQIRCRSACRQSESSAGWRRALSMRPKATSKAHGVRALLRGGPVPLPLHNLVERHREHNDGAGDECAPRFVDTEKDNAAADDLND
jgi:hypothetical protein